jgi:alpha-methylacyl-CoA racemase
MILADFGATVTRIDRTQQSTSSDVLCRGKRSIAIDLKKPSGRGLLHKMIQASDVVIDPFRPGVMEKLGLGPDVFLGEKGTRKSIIYARVAG